MRDAAAARLPRQIDSLHSARVQPRAGIHGLLQAHVLLSPRRHPSVDAFLQQLFPSRNGRRAGSTFPCLRNPYPSPKPLWCGGRSRNRVRRNYWDRQYRLFGSGAHRKTGPPKKPVSRRWLSPPWTNARQRFSTRPPRVQRDGDPLLGSPSCCRARYSFPVAHPRRDNGRERQNESRTCEHGPRFLAKHPHLSAEKARNR